MGKWKNEKESECELVTCSCAGEPICSMRSGVCRSREGKRKCVSEGER